MEVTGRRTELSAIVLAGGRSSRMGQDKALISIEGVPLLKRVFEAAQQCADPIWIVTPWSARYQDLLPASCQFLQEMPLPEENAPHGPLVGFAQGLTKVQTDWVLLLACDLPQLRAEVLQTAVGELGRVRQATIALLPRNSKGWEPLCGFYRRRCLPTLMDFINAGGRSFQSWLSQQPVEELLLTDAHILFNCNTPEDVTALKTLL